MSDRKVLLEHFYPTQWASAQQRQIFCSSRSPENVVEAYEVSWVSHCVFRIIRC